MIRTTPFILLTLLALLSIMLTYQGCKNNSDMNDHNIRLTGHIVAPTSGGDTLKAGHGHFSLENQSAQEVTLQLTSLILLIGKEATALTATTVYDQGKERALNPADVTLEADEKLDLLLGFPEVPYTDASGLRVEVVATFTAGDSSYSAISPVIHTRRIPR